MALEEKETVQAKDDGRSLMFKDMHTLWRGLLKNWYLFLIVGLLAGVAGFVYT